MTIKEEIILGNRIQNKKTKPSRRRDTIQTLIAGAMPEAFLYAGKCCKGRVTEGALTSLSYIGLVKAAKNFKPGTLRFFSYAKIYVRSEVFRHFRGLAIVKNVPNENITDVGAEETTQFDFDKIHSGEIWAVLLPMLKSLLTEPELFVMTRFYIDNRNLREIGDELRASRSWAQELHSRAMLKVRANADLIREKLDL